jgi:serine/threonine-protein kinase
VSDEPLDPDLMPAAPEPQEATAAPDPQEGTAQPADRDEGKIAGRYVVGERIGQSPMTEVFRGSDTVLGGTVAVKILSRAYASDDEFRTRFVDEAKAAEKLSHPNVASVYASGTQDGRTFVVMEYVEGRTLAQTIAGGALEPERATRIAEDVCRALAVAHSSGIIHRDIRPGNIMLTRRGQVKVMDFGIARRPATADDAESAAYLSPEQARGATPDQRSDIYSLGVVLYEMLTGKRPFEGDSAVALAYQHAEKTAVPPSQLVEGLPQGLDAAVRRAMEKDPSRRFISAERFRRELETSRGAGDESQQMPTTIPELAGEPGGQLIESAAGAHTIVMRSSGGGRGHGSNPWVRYAAIGVIVVAAVVLLLLLLMQPSDAVSIPDVHGVPANLAASELADIGLSSRQVTMTSLEVSSGSVVKTDPAAGESVKKGTVVTLYIAAAPATVGVPNIVGWTVSVASGQLAPVGLSVGTVTSQPSTTVPAGIIIAQDPAQGTQVTPGSTVNVTISGGSTPVIVPNLVCAGTTSATEQLAEVGLQIQVVGYEASDLCPGYNRVTAQDPPPGTSAKPGTVVQVWTNTYNQPSPSPTPSATASISPTPTPGR